MRRESFSLNPYEVLGVSPNASNKEIQAAYRQHALRWHPDRNPTDDYAMRMMQRVNAAWAILKDEHSRSAYDRWERGGCLHTASGPCLLGINRHQNRLDWQGVVQLVTASAIFNGVFSLPERERTRFRSTCYSCGLRT